MTNSTEYTTPDNLKSHDTFARQPKPNGKIVRAKRRIKEGVLPKQTKSGTAIKLPVDPIEHRFRVAEREERKEKKKQQTAFAKMIAEGYGRMADEDERAENAINKFVAAREAQNKAHKQIEM